MSHQPVLPIRDRCHGPFSGAGIANAACCKRVPRESLDAPEDLPKQPVCQVALGQLEDEVLRMPDEAPAGLAVLLGKTMDQATSHQRPGVAVTTPIFGEAGVVRKRLGADTEGLLLMGVEQIGERLG